MKRGFDLKPLSSLTFPFLESHSTLTPYTTTPKPQTSLAQIKREQYQPTASIQYT